MITGIHHFALTVHDMDRSIAFYRDLFGEWARDRFFPVLYSRARIDAAAAERTRLSPR